MTNILVSIGIAVLAVVLNALVNVRLRFASDREEATRSLKELLRQVFRWIVTGLLIVKLIFDVVSSAPLTRLEVFMIALQVSALVSIFVMSLLDVVAQ